jgi:O-antigen ligase
LLLIAATGIAACVAMRQNPSFAAHLTALAALFPAISLVLLFRAVWQSAHGQPVDNWLSNFPNVRIYDSATLVCLFLLWLRPAWLARPALTAPVTLLGALYVMSLLIDGARSALLSIVSGLFFAALLGRGSVQWRLPGISILLGAMLFVGLTQLPLGTSYPFGTVNTILRTGTSERFDLWEKALGIWLQFPLTGIGGGIFGAVRPASTAMHPHNFPLQMLAEWGLTGLCILMISGILVWQVLQGRTQVPSMLVAGVIAIAVDSLFSGNLVYPTSQILCLWLGALALSRIPAQETRQEAYSWLLAGKILVLAIALAGILAIWLQHAGDLGCLGCKSRDAVGSLRFWHFGRAIHLTP